MYFKVAVFAALLALCHAGYIEDNHGQAVSSQNIVRHSQQNQQNTQHLAPVVEHVDTLLHHAGPVYDQAAYLQHSAPLVHTAPLIHNVAGASAVQYKVPVSIGEHPQESGPAKYEFSYSVDDPHTGDQKSQQESREGDVVKGEYSLLQPDGSIRKVEYTADDHNGFNAVVHNSEPNPHAAPPSPAPTAVKIAPIVQAAKVVQTAPVVHAAPLVHAVHSAPVVHAAPVLHTASLVHAAPIVHAAPTHFFTAHH